MDAIDAIIAADPCIVGMGNPFRKDDGLGVYIINKLMRQCDYPGITFFNAEDIIESYAYKISMCENDTVILIDAMDAVDTDVAPGTIIFDSYNNFFEEQGCYSTHKLSLKLSCKILEQSGKEIYILGIIPADIDFGQGFTPEIQASADLVADALTDFITKQSKESAHV